MIGNDFIQFAGQLAATTKAPSEAAMRTVVSRAYYGAFHSTLEFFSQVNVTNEGNHGEVIRMLRNSSQYDCERAGDSLKELYNQRRIADYELTRAEFATPEIAKRAVEIAHEILDLLNQCRSEPALSTARAGIQAYQQKIRGSGH